MAVVINNISVYLIVCNLVFNVAQKLLRNTSSAPPQADHCALMSSDISRWPHSTTAVAPGLISTFSSSSPSAACTRLDQRARDAPAGAVPLSACEKAHTTSIPFAFHLFYLVHLVSDYCLSATDGSRYTYDSKRSTNGIASGDAAPKYTVTFPDTPYGLLGSDESMRDATGAAPVPVHTKMRSFAALAVSSG